MVRKDKSIYMESTKKEPEETAGEIQKVLRQYGLRQFMTAYDDKTGEISGVYFSISKDGSDIPFRLPINHVPLLRIARERKNRYIRDKDQATRVAWRQVMRWIYAQLAMVDVGMVEITEVFFSYMLVDQGEDKTIFDKLKENKFKMLSKYSGNTS